jgi:predicted signal transduction protein with EAL and GGDEF domain
VPTQSFVRQFSTAPGETIIVAAVTSMGRSCKLRVIAEGVETKATGASSSSAMRPGATVLFHLRALPEEFAKLLETGVAKSVLNRGTSLEQRRSAEDEL